MKTMSKREQSIMAMTELIYHAMRARELCADAVSLTLRWDPMGAVCAWGIQVLQDIETDAESVWDIGDEDVNEGVVYCKLAESRRRTFALTGDLEHPSNGARIVRDAWRRVVRELGEIARLGYEWPEVRREDIENLVADHVECNIIAEEE